MGRRWKDLCVFAYVFLRSCVCLFVYHIHESVTVRVFANMMNISVHCDTLHCVCICTLWTGDTGAPPPCVTVPIQAQWTFLSSDINSLPQRNHVQVHFQTSLAANDIHMLYCPHLKSWHLTLLFRTITPFKRRQVKESSCSNIHTSELKENIYIKNWHCASMPRTAYTCMCYYTTKKCPKFLWPHKTVTSFLKKKLPVPLNLNQTNALNLHSLKLGLGDKSNSIKAQAHNNDHTSI